MYVCPKCGREKSGMICGGCGFDESCDFLRYPTLSRLPPQTENKTPTLKYGKKDDFEEDENSLLHCAVCGGTDFKVLLPGMKLQCADCRAVPKDIKLTENSSKEGFSPIDEGSREETADHSGNRGGSAGETEGFEDDASAENSRRTLINETEAQSLLSDIFSETIRKAGRPLFECESWEDIVSVSAGHSHIVALRKNGTVVSCGSNEFGQCETYEWRDIAAVSAGAFHTVGVRKNGTAVAVGKDTDGQCQVYGWRDITAVSAGKFHTLGLTADGKMTAAGRKKENMCNVGLWSRINGISAGTFHSVALRKPVAYAVGSNHNGECDVYGWRGVSAVSAGEFFTLGLLKSGKVAAAGKNDCGQCKVEGWNKIICISAGAFVSAGVRKDGTVITTDENVNKSISGWKNIKEVSVGECCIAGLKYDGTVVSAEVKRYLK